MAERGLDVSYETVRRWVLNFGPLIAAALCTAAPKVRIHFPPRNYRGHYTITTMDNIQWPGPTNNFTRGNLVDVGRLL